MSRLRAAVVPALNADGYMHLVERGWRRFGPVTFRPECPSCQMCRSLRVTVHAFRPSQSQRRAWRRNHGIITVRIGTPAISPDKEALYQRFHEYQRATKGWPMGEGLTLFVDNPFPCEEWCYYVGDTLVGVGYVDVLPRGLSAIYFYYEPAERARSLGTFNVLAVIDAARRRGLPHVYLGYYVEGCRSLEYKAAFRPNEVLAGGDAWASFRE